MYFYFSVFVDVYVDNVFVRCRQVLSLGYLYSCVAEAFFVVVSFYYFFGAVNNVWRNLVSFHQLEPFFQILAFAFAGTVVVYCRNARLRFEGKFEPYLVTGYFLNFYLY